MNSENNKPIFRSKNNQGRARTLENDPPFICGVSLFSRSFATTSAISKSSAVPRKNCDTCPELRIHTRYTHKSANRGIASDTNVTQRALNCFGEYIRTQQTSNSNLKYVRTWYRRNVCEMRNSKGIHPDRWISAEILNSFGKNVEIYLHRRIID